MGGIATAITTEPNELDLRAVRPVRRLFQSIFGVKAPVSLDGYLMPCSVEGYVMFSQSCASPMWVRIPVARVRELVWLGHDSGAEPGLEHVRLTL